MEITLAGAALNTLFFGMCWALIKTIEFFISKYRPAKQDTQTDDIRQDIKEMNAKFTKLHDIEGLTKEQIKSLQGISGKIEKLFDWHNVYNENHVLAWYMPSELLSLVRDANKTLANLEDYTLDEIRDNQNNIVEHISTLITSQRILTERLSDLINTLNKNLH